MLQFVQDPATANTSGRGGPGEVGVAPEELPHPPFGSDYRIKIKLQSLFLYCYTKEVVSAPGDYHALLSISPMLMIAYRAYSLYCMGKNLFHKIFL